MYFLIVLEKTILECESLTLIMSENVSSATGGNVIFKQNKGEISLCLKNSHSLPMDLRNYRLESATSTAVVQSRACHLSPLS